MDYIQLKHTIMELDKQATDWRRKLELLQVGRTALMAALHWHDAPGAHVAATA